MCISWFVILICHILFLTYFSILKCNVSSFVFCITTLHVCFSVSFYWIYDLFVFIFYSFLIYFFSFLREKKAQKNALKKSIWGNNKKHPPDKLSEAPNKNDHENINMDSTKNMDTEKGLNLQEISVQAMDLEKVRWSLIAKFFGNWWQKFPFGKYKYGGWKSQRLKEINSTQSNDSEGKNTDIAVREIYSCWKSSP